MSQWFDLSESFSRPLLLKDKQSLKDGGTAASLAERHPRPRNSPKTGKNVTNNGLRHFVRVFQTCLSRSALQVSQKYRTWRHPSEVLPFPMPQECPKISSKDSYLVRAPNARLHRKILVAKCFPGCAEGLSQGQPLSP